MSTQDFTYMLVQKMMNETNRRMKNRWTDGQLDRLHTRAAYSMLRRLDGQLDRLQTSSVSLLNDALGGAPPDVGTSVGVWLAATNLGPGAG